MTSSGAALLLLAPLMLGVALMVKATSKGPVLYGHTRIGHSGRRFRCWKFRSMVTDGDAVLARHLRDNPDARAEWDETLKLHDDPRVTRIGHVLRALSIDELPQLLNIFLGDMSVVGPRPVTEGELQRYGVSAAHYLRTRPGLTGLWQVSGRSDVSYHRRVLMDRYYVAHWSFVSDIGIIARTIPAVVLARGSR
jgi:exopolysaccharide production protein ExoY